MMRILFFVDTHGSMGSMRRLKEKTKDAEMLVCAGDFTIFENDMTIILRELNDIGKPVLLIHGNHETSSSVMMECEQFKNLHFIHRNYYIAGDLIFYGFGGGGFSVHDESFAREAELFMAEFNRISASNGRKYRLVLITHAPPYGTRLDDLGEHVGNKNIASFISRHHPILAVSGHLHENAGMDDRTSDTHMINPGPEGVILDL
jgi:Icc-related predicted phosphoesterase